MQIYRVTTTQGRFVTYWSDDDLWDYYIDRVEKQRPWPIEPERWRILEQMRFPLVQQLLGLMFEPVDPLEGVKYAEQKRLDAQARLDDIKKRRLEYAFEMFEMEHDEESREAFSKAARQHRKWEDHGWPKSLYLKANTPIQCAIKYCGVSELKFVQEYVNSGRTIMLDEAKKRLAYATRT